MDYLELLNRSFGHESEWENSYTKLEFLSDHIFNFTTYENIVSMKMAKKAVEVCSSITNRDNFDYISEEDNNLWYLIMVNMPFFTEKLEWGTSIRGAWWDIFELSDNKHNFDIDTCGLWDEDNKQISLLKFKDEVEWNSFVKAMEEFIIEEGII